MQTIMLINFNVDDRAAFFFSDERCMYFSKNLSLKSLTRKERTCFVVEQWNLFNANP